MVAYTPRTLDEVMAAHCGANDMAFTNLSLCVFENLGMFARLLVMLTLLRALLLFGQGKHDAESLLVHWGVRFDGVHSENKSLVIVAALGDALAQVSRRPLSGGQMLTERED